MSTVTTTPPTAPSRNRWLILTVVLVLQLLLVGLAVAPRLSARLTGDEYVLRVAPVDPIDPFRGAYVALSYPDLRQNDSSSWDGGLGSVEDGESGDLFLTLGRRGDVWVATGHTRHRPDDGPYLACDDRGWQIRCGIESWFASQSEALRLEQLVREGDVYATVRIDGRGNAAIVDIGTR